MKLSINAEHFCDRADGSKRPLETALKLCADAGFSNVDLLVPENEAEQTAEILETYALKVNQSHCPFNRYTKKDYALFAEDILSAVRSAHRLGSKILVVHGDSLIFPPRHIPRKRFWISITVCFRRLSSCLTGSA